MVYVVLFNTLSTNNFFLLIFSIHIFGHHLANYLLRSVCVHTYKSLILNCNCGSYCYYYLYLCSRQAFLHFDVHKVQSLISEITQ